MRLQLALIVLALAFAALSGQIVWGDQIIWGDEIIWGTLGENDLDYLVWGN